MAFRRHGRPVMGSLRLRHKVLLVVVAGVAVGGLATAAFAYWTASGTGSGTASVGTDSGVAIQNVAFSGSLYPGGAVTVTFDIHNGSANAPVKVGNVVADEGAGTHGITGLTGGCLATDFTFDPVTVNAEIAAGATQTSVTGTLHMADTGINQDACKTETPVLHLTTDNSGI